MTENYVPIEQELFHALFQFNLQEIDSSDISEYFLHELVTVLSRRLMLSVDQYVFVKDVIWKLFRTMIAYISEDFNSDNSSVNSEMINDLIDEDEDEESLNSDDG